MPAQAGRVDAGQPTPPMRKREAIAISFNGESFGGIGTSICNGSPSLHSCCFYDICFVASVMQWVVDSWSVLEREQYVEVNTSSYVKT